MSQLDAATRTPSFGIANRVHLHRQAILAAASQYGLSNIRIFGSAVRGGDGAARDLDLLVTGGDETSLFDLSGFQFEVEKLIGVQVDVVEEIALSKYFRESVLAEAQPL